MTATVVCYEWRRIINVLIITGVQEITATEITSVFQHEISEYKIISHKDLGYKMCIF
jgi:hypothetical protein